MARLLRIENCYQCPHIISRYRTPGMGCMQVRDEDGEPSDLGGGCSGTPDWCPLPEASGWIPVGERRPTERGTYEIAMPPLSQNEQYPYILVCEWAPAYGFHSEVCGTTFVYDADVIAWRRWQPLPALPKEATDADR